MTTTNKRNIFKFKLKPPRLHITEQSDNTRVQRPVVRKPIKYTLKPGEQFIKVKGQTLVHRPKQEVIGPDDRSQYQKKQDEERREALYKKYEEQKNEEAAAEGITAMTKLISPSTYIGPMRNDNGKPYIENVMSGEGTGDPALNFAIDLATPALVRKIITGVGEEIPYLFPKAKLYSDNSLVNAYATLARRYNLPDKARLPYLIRRIKSNQLDFDGNNVILTGNRWDHANFTYDMPVIAHRKGSWDAAQQTLLVNPRQFIFKTKWGSIEPSDMFNINKTPTVNSSDVINITANPTAKRLSQKYGIQTVSNKNLRQSELYQLNQEHSAYLNNYGRVFKIAKSGRSTPNDDYFNAVLEEINKFGRPKVKDVRLLEEITGLKSYIQPIEDANIFRSINYDDIKNTPINKIQEVLNSLPKFNNGRSFKALDFGDYSGVNKPYRNFFYDPATTAESKFNFNN